MLGKSSLLSAAAAMLGFSTTHAEASESIKLLGRAMAMQDHWMRRRNHDQHRPAGTKLLRKAAKGRLGMATLR